MTSVLVFVAALVNPPQASCEPQLAPLQYGTSWAGSKLPLWRKEEAGPWKGAGWVGWSYNASVLRPVRFNVEDLPKQQPDDDDEVTVETVPHVDYAVRCIPAIRPGPLSIGRRHTDNSPVLNESLNSSDTRRLGITLGDRKYEVRLESKEESLSDARIVLSDGRQTQVLFSADGAVDDPHFEIQWAGDLDRDGRLDLIVNLSHKYTVHPIELLLSSKAARGQLVGLAATFLTGD